MYIRRCGHYNGPLWAHFITLAVCLGLCILESRKEGEREGGWEGEREGEGEGEEEVYYYLVRWFSPNLYCCACLIVCFNSYTTSACERSLLYVL